MRFVISNANNSTCIDDAVFSVPEGGAGRPGKSWLFLLSSTPLRGLGVFLVVQCQCGPSIK